MLPLPKMSNEGHLGSPFTMDTQSFMDGLPGASDDSRFVWRMASCKNGVGSNVVTRTW